MGKLSKYIDLKPEIIEHFKQGKTAYEVVKLYGLSVGTVYDWFRKYKGIEPKPRTKNSKEPTELDNYKLIKKTLEDLLTASNTSEKIKMDAAKKLLEIIELEKKAVLDNQLKDTDDLTRYFGKHLKINEIKPPKYLEVDVKQFIQHFCPKSKIFCIRGFNYKLIEYDIDCNSVLKLIQDRVK